MANYPIQVVMNSSDYIEEEKRSSRRGNRKDYYSGRDDVFREHKEHFATQLDLFSKIQEESQFTKIAYAKVVLDKKAIAKSNRPTEKIITSDNDCKVIGGNRAGEMIVRFMPYSARKIKAAIENAEDNTTWDFDKKGRRVAKPSVWRSEVGAIKDILPFSAQDKCPFSAADVVAFLKEYGMTYLYVDLFETVASGSDIMLSSDRAEALKMFTSFESGLESFAGIKAFRSSLHTAKRSFVIYMTTDSCSMVKLREDIVSSDVSIHSINTNAEDYESLLNYLKSHPLVKKVSLPPVIQDVPEPSFRYDDTQNFVIPKPVKLDKYPLIGVADTGIAKIFENWVAARVDNINPKYKDDTHGSFISGLYITGKVLNQNVIKEADGNRLVEICVLPKNGSFDNVYKKGIEEFLINLRASIEEAVETTGVRIIGLSMNVNVGRLNDEYSAFAKELDDIAESYNVIIIISAGNLKTPHHEWNTTDTDANISEYTSRVDNIVYAPAESIRNLTVGALNPPDNLGLTNYTCIGKGLATGTKPDLVHVGGFGNLRPNIGTGLYSIKPDGRITTGCGTSYSAPLVAKTLAALDFLIEGDVPRETLMALVVHNARVPSAFVDKKYKQYLKDWIGFGMPLDSESILNGSENAVSLVFHNTIRKGQVLSFPFSWPASLVADGKCRGHVKVSVVCTPQLDYDYEEELVREGVRLSLCQINAEGVRSQTRLKPIYSTARTPSAEAGLDEEDRKESLYKWHPVKVYEMEFKGISHDAGSWRLEARYLDRENVIPSPNGLVFTIIMTIEDSSHIAPVYNEMRLMLQTAGVQISDIQTAIRISPRVGR